jgi:hypothetical protein
LGGHVLARAALAQGVFLGLLGLGVIGSTIYHFVNQTAPEAGLMGIFGLIALGVKSPRLGRFSRIAQETPT